MNHETSAVPAELAPQALGSAAPDPDMVWIPGGGFRMGSDRHYPEERPVHRVSVDGFWIDRRPVTNERVRALRRGDGPRHLRRDRRRIRRTIPGALPEMLYAGSLVFVKPARPGGSGADSANWWQFMRGADWRHPQGPGSSIAGLERPSGRARGVRRCRGVRPVGGQGAADRGRVGVRRARRSGRSEYAWGDEFMPGGPHMANTWQGEFPWQNRWSDGYEGTSPVGAFPANGYGLYDMIGNVWEWTTDWYRAGPSGRSSEGLLRPAQSARVRRGRRATTRASPAIRIPRKVLKGGSHLCAPNYCRRYRPAARFPEPVDTSTCHVGFRCIARPSRD